MASLLKQSLPYPQIVESSSTRVVFMGSPEFAVPTLRALQSSGYDIRLVITQPDRPSGRGGRVAPPPIKVAAELLGLDVFQPATLRDDTVVDRIALASPDIFVVAAYGKIIPRRILSLATRGSLNVHASLLPRWRGASPITAAILAGDTQTGVSIMEVVARMDAGPVVAASAIPIEATDTTGSLDVRLADLGAQLLIQTMPGWLSGALAAVPQDEAATTYCTLTAKQDGHLRTSMTAVEAERAIRAYDPWPGAFVDFRDHRLAIWRASVIVGDEPPAIPGTLSIIGRRPAVAFAGGWLALDQVQRQGARRVTGAEFLNGERANVPVEVGLA